MSSRTIALGDIHGCSAALATLLEAICPGPEDVLVTLGDYTDRGPDSRGVLNALIDLPNRCRLVPLRGNHEETFYSRDGERARAAAWIQPDLLAYLGEQPLSFTAEVSGKRLLVVHGSPFDPPFEYVNLRYR